MIQKPNKTPFFVLIFTVFIYGQNMSVISANKYEIIKTTPLLKKQYSNTSIFTFDEIWDKNSTHKTTWFYKMGSYNDLWGSDILEFPLFNPTTTLFLPQNTVFNISIIKNHPISTDRFTYLTVFGFPVKKLGNLKSKSLFYGSENFDY